jgi:hypothetical protein
MSSPIPALFLGPSQFARTNIGHVLSLGPGVERVWAPCATCECYVRSRSRLPVI